MCVKEVRPHVCRKLNSTGCSVYVLGYVKTLLVYTCVVIGDKFYCRQQYFNCSDIDAIELYVKQDDWTMRKI